LQSLLQPYAVGPASTLLRRWRRDVPISQTRTRLPAYPAAAIVASSRSAAAIIAASFAVIAASAAATAADSATSACFASLDANAIAWHCGARLAERRRSGRRQRSLALSPRLQIPRCPCSPQGPQRRWRRCRAVRRGAEGNLAGGARGGAWRRAWLASGGGQCGGGRCGGGRYGGGRCGGGRCGGVRCGGGRGAAATAAWEEARPYDRHPLWVFTPVRPHAGGGSR